MPPTPPDAAAKPVTWWRRLLLEKKRKKEEAPRFKQQMLIYGLKMVIIMFIIAPALQRDGRERLQRAPGLALRSTRGLMNLAQSKASHYATNFCDIVLFC